MRRNVLISQVNNVISTFSKLDSHVQSDLLYTYCSSLYGSVLWDLQDNTINKLSSVWNIALRRVWHLPYNTHRNIIYALAGKWSMFDELCRRLLKFVSTCLYNDNATVSSVTRFALNTCFSQ